jgi:hypothetical protein
MKALLPMDSTPGTYFMAAFLLGLPADMIDHIISKDFKNCTKRSAYSCTAGGGATPSPLSTQTMRRPSTPSPAAAIETSPHVRWREHLSPSRPGRSHRKIPGPYKDDSDICYYHTTYGNQARKCKPGCQWIPGNGAAAKN